MSIETFQIWLAVVAFVWGAVWGSFLNVVIYRLPAGISLISPPSRCPKCETPLAWYDNVPILGWLWLRGKCRYCGVSIPARYPGVELFTGIMSLLVWLHVSGDRLLEPQTPEMLQNTLVAVGAAFFFYFYFVAILIAITFIDLDETIIPHELTATGTALGLAAAFLMPRTGPMIDLWPQVQWMDSVIGLLVGGAFIAFIIKGYAFVRGIEGMGWGDFTLMGMCGTWVGWRGVIFVLFAASVQGLLAVLVYAVVQKLRGKSVAESAFLTPDDLDAIDNPEAAQQDQSPQSDAEDSGAEKKDGANGEGEDEEEVGFGQLAIPFGPWIALAAVEFVLIGERVLPWLLGI